MKKLLKERFQQLAGLRPLYRLNEVRGPLDIEKDIKRGETMDMGELRDDYGLDYSVDMEPIENLFDEEGKAKKDIVIVYDQRGDMYLMHKDDIEKYH
tara:strand:+ start:765 stop:1055 length:291 start_codon:yes stop_codon:yes gene_type:complete